MCLCFKRRKSSKQETAETSIAGAKQQPRIAGLPMHAVELSGGGTVTQ